MEHESEGKEENAGSKVHAFTRTSNLKKLEEDCPANILDKEDYKEAEVSYTTTNSVEGSAPEEISTKKKNETKKGGKKIVGGVGQVEVFIVDNGKGKNMFLVRLLNDSKFDL